MRSDGALECWSTAPIGNCTPRPRGWECFQGGLGYAAFLGLKPQAESLYPFGVQNRRCRNPGLDRNLSSLSRSDAGLHPPGIPTALHGAASLRRWTQYGALPPENNILPPLDKTSQHGNESCTGRTVCCSVSFPAGFCRLGSGEPCS